MGTEDDQITHFCLAAALTLFDLDTVLKIVNTVLQERQVIVYSKNLSILTTVM